MRGGEPFEALYEGIGRQSVAPERLLRASLLQAFYSVRSERQLMEQINYNLLFRWFVGLGIDDAVWDHSTFSKNRERFRPAAKSFREPVSFANTSRRSPEVQRLCARRHPGRPTYVVTFRFKQPDGEMVWLEETGKAEFRDMGGLVRLKGLTLEVTARKRSADQQSLVKSLRKQTERR